MAQNFFRQAKLKYDQGIEKLTQVAEKTASNIRKVEEERKAAKLVSQNSIAYYDQDDEEELKNPYLAKAETNQVAEAASKGTSENPNLQTALPGSVSLFIATTLAKSLTNHLILGSL